jgi:hypothetical protein
VQTVSPLAARLGLVVIARFAAGQERDLAREISGRPGVTLVAWHHEAIHEIAHNLGKVEPTPPGHWPHDRFDMIWTFTRTRTDGDSRRYRSCCCPAISRIRSRRWSVVPRKAHGSSDGSSGAERLRTAPATAGEVLIRRSSARSRTARWDSTSSPVRSTAPVTAIIRGPTTSSRR